MPANTPPTHEKSDALGSRYKQDQKQAVWVMASLPPPTNVGKFFTLSHGCFFLPSPHVKGKKIGEGGHARRSPMSELTQKEKFYSGAPTLTMRGRVSSNLDKIVFGQVTGRRRPSCRRLPGCSVGWSFQWFAPPMSGRAGIALGVLLGTAPSAAKRTGKAL
jgi:hypothetical protein